jgi:acyl-CoA synthetase (AMP-forming)/AMP-acid ligase II
MSSPLFSESCIHRKPDSSTRLVLGNLAAWTHASAIVYASPVFDPPAIVDAVVKENCTALHGVPTHFLGVLSEVSKRRRNGELSEGRLGRLRTGIAAGSPVPVELMQKLINEIGLVGLTNAYGMSEPSFIILVAFRTFDSLRYLV